MSPLTGQDVLIVGDFTRDEAERLAIMLSSPPMPAPLVVIETRTH